MVKSAIHRIATVQKSFHFRHLIFRKTFLNRLSNFAETQAKRQLIKNQSNCNWKTTISQAENNEAGCKISEMLWTEIETFQPALFASNVEINLISKNYAFCKVLIHLFACFQCSFGYCCRFGLICFFQLSQILAITFRCFRQLALKCANRCSDLFQVCESFLSVQRIHYQCARIL